MKSNWRVSRTNREYLNYLSGSLSISPVFAQILVNRGLKDADAIRSFLYPSLEKLHDPFLLPDMEQGIARARAAIDQGEKIMVHGDYDADGITSTALLVSVFRSLGVDTIFHVPNRLTEGYGLSLQGIEKAAAAGVALIITADCGVSSAEEVQHARSLGMDVIITDHHEPPEKLPEASAVINPCRRDSSYPFRQLAGVGVAFKLVQALCDSGAGQGLKIEEMMDLVALGTIADSVPLLDENRIIVHHGLKSINNGSSRIGIEAIKEVAGVNGGSRAGALSFSLIPRINASGRLDDASQAVELFLTEDRGKAAGIAGLLEEQNRKRRRIEQDVLGSALKMIDREDPGNAIVLASPDWHPGVIGIVASRLVDMFYRPAILLSVDGDTAKGSGRSIPPFHLYDAIHQCSDLLVGYGGHSQAAGVKLETDRIPALREKMNQIAGERLRGDDLVPVLELDAAVRLSEMSLSLIQEMSLLEPFGASNREPVFGAREIDIVNHTIVGNNHLKMQLRQDNFRMDTIGFSMGSQLADVSRASQLDIAFIPRINEWNGMKSVQLNLKAIRPSL